MLNHIYSITWDGRSSSKVEQQQGRPLALIWASSYLVLPWKMKHPSLSIVVSGALSTTVQHTKPCSWYTQIIRSSDCPWMPGRSNWVSHAQLYLLITYQMDQHDPEVILYTLLKQISCLFTAIVALYLCPSEVLLVDVTCNDGPTCCLHTVFCLVWWLRCFSMQPAKLSPLLHHGVLQMCWLIWTENLQHGCLLWRMLANTSTPDRWWSRVLFIKVLLC